jgi:Ketosteroid isomerase-related protein
MSTTNDALLREAFEAAEKGDASKLVNLYSDDFVWAGWNLEGGQQVYTKDEFLSALGVLAKLDDAATDIVGTETVADDIVIAKVRAYRRLGDTTLDTTIVMVHRFTDGKVTGGADVCPAAFENFWTTVGITG